MFFIYRVWYNTIIQNRTLTFSNSFDSNLTDSPRESWAFSNNVAHWCVVLQSWMVNNEIEMFDVLLCCTNEYKTGSILLTFIKSVNLKESSSIQKMSNLGIFCHCHSVSSVCSFSLCLIWFGSTNSCCYLSNNVMSCIYSLRLTDAAFRLK